MAKKPQPVGLTRHQFYVLAAHATFAKDTKVVIDSGSYENGAVTVAWKPKDQEKNGVRSNGWIYYRMDKDGNLRLLKEDGSI